MLPLFLLYINICRYGMYCEFIYFYFLKRMSAAIFLIFLEGRDTAWRGRGTLINSIKPTGCACLISSWVSLRFGFRQVAMMIVGQQYKVFNWTKISCWMKMQRFLCGMNTLWHGMARHVTHSIHKRIIISIIQMLLLLLLLPQDVAWLNSIR